MDSIFAGESSRTSPDSGCLLSNPYKAKCFKIRIAAGLGEKALRTVAIAGV
jgi:hypothetical protein